MLGAFYHKGWGRSTMDGVVRTPPLPPLPQWIGHRGAAARAPENTLAGFRRAAADGARWIECDVRLTADGVPVLLHDATLERTTDGSGPLAAVAWEALRERDAGAWFGSRFRGERVPSLAEALLCCAELGLGANLELKAEDGGERELARAVAAALRAPAPPVLISSFSAAALREAARESPGTPRGLLLDGAPADGADRAATLGCASVHAAAAALDRRSAAALRARGAALLAYTVNDPARARELFALGVAAVFTDDPARMSAG